MGDFFFFQFPEMGWWFFGIFLGLVALGVEGYPAKDLVLRLPGQPKVDFKQFVGYVDVDEKAGRSLFYYLVEQLGMLIRTPYGLTLWLNGGWFFLPLFQCLSFFSSFSHLSCQE